MSSFMNTLFGTIAGPGFSMSPSVDFIPKNGSGQTIDVSGKDAQWWGLKSRDMQRKAYELCYPVASVIDRLAEYDITGIIEILRAKGKGKNDFATNEWSQRMTKLLSQPNPLQTWEQFRGEQVVYKKTFGFCPVLPFVPAGMSPENAISMVNLPPWCITPEPTNKIAFTSKISDRVKKWKFTVLGESFELAPDQLIILEDSFFMDYENGLLLPQSRLIGLDMAISNLCAAMEADNVLLRKKGPLGFITHDAAATKDSVAGYIPMTQAEKDELQNALTQYGLTLTQYQYVISRQAAKWNPMSFNVAELGTKETIIASEKAICHRYGFPYVLYEEVDATFANSNVAAKAVYQNNIIPNNTKDLNKYNKFFKAEENQCIIVNNFSNIAALQEDEKYKAEAAKAWDEAFLVEYDNNLITKNQWLEARGYDKIADGDKYKKDEVTTTQPQTQPQTPKDENSPPENTATQA